MDLQTAPTNPMTKEIVVNKLEISIGINVNAEAVHGHGLNVQCEFRVPKGCAKDRRRRRAKPRKLNSSTHPEKRVLNAYHAVRAFNVELGVPHGLPACCGVRPRGVQGTVHIHVL